MIPIESFLDELEKIAAGHSPPADLLGMALGITALGAGVGSATKAALAKNDKKRAARVGAYGGAGASMGAMAGGFLGAVPLLSGKRWPGLATMPLGAALGGGMGYAAGKRFGESEEKRKSR